ncbi:T9SS type A sorting domain-containing protein [Rufibacter latericius]|uniref:T9SS C-terminal target domain-containing protein n=1 Tax=Rufibacter latericius TaxID=2487040 RepID=A0A3M9MDH0_9BACT|nr:T9SS type A sorting domain-containing protein [Rufibacter latericius]RNI23599.1 T9SS C-terminal target domain-containing protein [Rufibacter latericius]
MSHPHKNLNHYFEAAKTQEPVMPLSELKEALHQLPAGANAGKQTSAVAGKKAAFWVVGSLGALVGAFLLWLSLTDEPQKPIAQQTSPVTTSAVKQENGPQNGGAKPTAASAKSTASGVQAVAATQQSTATPAGKTAEESVVQGKTISAKGQSITVDQAPGSVKILEKTKPLEPKEGEKVFGNIALLELPRNVERKLGIEVNDRGIMYLRIFQDKDDSNVRLEFTIYGGGHSVNVYKGWKPGADSGKVAVIAPNLHPLYVSNRAGEQRVKYMMEGENERKLEPAYFTEIVNTLIPVLVRANNQAKDEAIFWYAATPDFLAQLPQPLRQDIMREYRQLAQQKNLSGDSSSLLTAPLNGVSTQLKYFESNPGSLSSIQYAVVFPNPTAEWLNLSMSLKREEEMRVSLVDINGKLVKTLSPYKRYAAGAVTEKFSIKGEARGLYLLLAETKSGHQHTQRIIIE